MASHKRLYDRTTSPTVVGRALDRVLSVFYKDYGYKEQGLRAAAASMLTDLSMGVLRRMTVADGRRYRSRRDEDAEPLTQQALRAGAALE